MSKSNSQKIPARVTLTIQRNVTRLDIRDDLSGIAFISIRLTPTQTIDLLSNLAEVPAESCEVLGLDKVGLKRETMQIEFPLPQKMSGSEKDTARRLLPKHVPEGWTASDTFDRQSSFITKKDITYARTYACRWVPVSVPEEQTK